jgi:hypothetical protein
MKPAFWIKRFFVVFAGMFVVLLAVGLLKGRAPRSVAMESAFWSLVATSIFLVTRLVRSRQGQHCELCRDTPELASRAPGESKPEDRQP